MIEAVQIWERPHADEIYMLVGWRQWADAGSVSSGLPHYLVKQHKARPIGEIRPDGFYLFQFPGTHDLVRPVVRFSDGFPLALQTPRNEMFYTTVARQNGAQVGLVILLGDEPHLDVDGYVAAILYAAQELNVRRIISMGGVYGELPYEKDRSVSAIYSLKPLKEQLSGLGVELSDYQGGASIGSYLCKRAGEQKMEHVGFYAFAPAYDLSSLAPVETVIRIENDYMAWLAVMRRIVYWLKLDYDLADLEEKSQHLVEVMGKKVDELAQAMPEADVRGYFNELNENYEEQPFNPLDEIWEAELKRLMEKFDDEES